MPKEDLTAEVTILCFSASSIAAIFDSFSEIETVGYKAKSRNFDEVRSDK